MSQDERDAVKTQVASMASELKEMSRDIEARLNVLDRQVDPELTSALRSLDRSIGSAAIVASTFSEMRFA